MKKLTMKKAPDRGKSDEWSTWGRTFRRAQSADRIHALRRISQSLGQSLSVTNVIDVLGDPVHRIPPRLSRLDRSRREVLGYRHPGDQRVQIQILIRDGLFETMQFVVDEGACRPPRILDVAAFWHEQDTRDRADEVAVS